MQDEETQKKKSVKRYFWLKLKEEFFQDKEIKKLRRIAGGDTYTIIYLKLMLLSLKSDGRLYFDGIEDSFYEELALEIDEDPENVKVTLMYLEKMSLVKLVSEDEMFLTQMDNLIVSESESAKRVRAHRARKKLLESSDGQLELPLDQEISSFKDNGSDDEALHGNGNVTECNSDETSCNTYTDTELEIKTKKKIKKESKHAFGEYHHVRLTDTEYVRLIKDYGEEAVIDGIKNVDEYCQEHGKKYSDYNLVMRKWGIKTPKLSDQVVQKIQKQQPTQEEIEEQEWANLTDDEWEAKMKALDDSSHNFEEFPRIVEEG